MSLKERSPGYRAARTDARRRARPFTRRFRTLGVKRTVTEATDIPGSAGIVRPPAALIAPEAAAPTRLPMSVPARPRKKPSQAIMPIRRGRFVPKARNVPISRYRSITVKDRVPEIDTSATIRTTARDTARMSRYRESACLKEGESSFQSFATKPLVAETARQGPDPAEDAGDGVLARQEEHEPRRALRAYQGLGVLEAHGELPIVHFLYFRGRDSRHGKALGIHSASLAQREEGDHRADPCIEPLRESPAEKDETGLSLLEVLPLDGASRAEVRACLADRIC